MNAPDSTSRTPLSAMVLWLLALLIAYTTWLWGGLRPSFHLAAVAAAALLFACLLLGASRAALLRDPFFWTGLLFLAYLTVQWGNAGRERYFDVGLGRWDYMPPRWPGWPSAFVRADALQMLTWFFPAWAIALAARAPVLSRASLRSLFLLMACGSGLLALFGMIQFLTDTKAIYWIEPLKCKFFASFGYANHAAAYFVLAGALTAGLLYRALFRSGLPANRTRLIMLACGLVLCLVGANLSLSRAGVILAWSFGCVAAGFGLVRGWRLLRPATRVYFAAVTIAAVGFFYFAAAGFGGKAIRKEFTAAKPVHHALFPVLDNVDLALGGRPLFARAAADMWLDHPWLGVGGWGYKYTVADYLPTSEWERLKDRGWANVHCDFLQFLVEFGIVGFGLMSGAVAVLVSALFRGTNRRSSLWIMGVAGLCLVVVFSFIDLPFRCPAILYTWVAILAVLPRLTQRVDPVEELSAPGHKYDDVFGRP